MLDLFSISVVMVRCLALLVIFNVIAAAPSALMFATRQHLTDGESLSPDYTMLVGIVTYIILATILWTGAKRFGKLLTIRTLWGKTFSFNRPE